MHPGLLETFQKNNALLDQIMKCLESYLETKRVAFPRFYFLSNDELLDILAQVNLNETFKRPSKQPCSFISIIDSQPVRCAAAFKKMFRRYFETGIWYENG